MREVERIDRILSLLKKEWEKHQGVSLVQLLFKLQYDYANSNEGQGVGRYQ